MKISELRQLSLPKLWKALDAARRELAVAKFHVETNQQQNTAKIKNQKKLIARMKTLINNEK